MAVNQGTLADEDGEFSDWIELHNAGANSVNLNGWFLTDNATQLTQWRFPGTNLAPNAYLIVFASGKNRRTPSLPLHTNFKLASSGEYLALVEPDGTTVASAYSPRFPTQAAYLSYGIPVRQTVTTLISNNALAQVWVPKDDALGTAWTGLDFDDSSWLTAQTGLGFETDGRTPFLPATVANSTNQFSGTQGQDGWFYGYWDRKNDADGVYAPAEFLAFPNDGGAFSVNNFWTGSAWDWFGGNPPFTELTRTSGQPTAPNGNPASADHWVIRRYVSTQAGPLAITGTLSHTSDWVRVTATGVATSSLLFIYLTGTGEGYIDDLSLVAGAAPGVGANLLANGGFESTTVAPWDVSPNLAGSGLTTAVKHSGSRSLRIVSSEGGSAQGNSIWQTIAPTLVNGNVYSLSYWYLPATNSTPLVVRTSGSWIATTPTYCSDGTVGRIFVDGVQIFQQPALVSSMNFALTALAKLGSSVDFVIDPGSAGNGACDGTIFTAKIATVDPATTVVADSAADWSISGTQGGKNWFYGSFNSGLSIPPPAYQASSFVEFPRNSGPPGRNNFWDGEAWNWFNGDPPFDEIGRLVMNPNGLNAGDRHWVIRRWVSDITGTITVNWTIIKQLASGAGATARILHNGVQSDSILVPGASASLIARRVVIPGVEVGDLIDIALDPTGLGGDYGDEGDRSFLSATILGQPNLTSQIASDIEASMHLVNASAYLRIPFTVDDPSAIQFLTLRMKYDDGFAAYLNGMLVASANAPGLPVWNSTAGASRSDADAVKFEEFNLTALRGLLRKGTNVLAIQGLNASAADSDFLVLPELLAASVTSDPSAPRYFTSPTPGGPNGFGSTGLGPLIQAAAHAPGVPRDDEDLSITTTVRATFNPIGSVSLIYRVNYGSEVTLPMIDDGQHGDGVAGDGVFGAVIPASASIPGQMVRYYLSATDTAGGSARFPPFEDPRDSPQYQGTVVADPGQTNPLPVLQMFVQNPTLATEYNGTRCSLFYDDEFYDNVGVNLHGQTTASAFAKRSMDFDMARGHGFRWDRQEARVNDFNLLTTAPDKAFVRHLLAYETFRHAGVPTHFAFPVRVQQNGAFHSVMHLVEKGDDRFLSRVGLDPNGALYKVYLPLTNAYGGVAEKKTRQSEASADLQALIAGLKLSGQARRQYLYDNIDIPEVINFLAAIQVVQNEDCCSYKNYYLYRDSEGTREWQMMPWDLDLTFGRVFTAWVQVGTELFGGYYDTNIYWMNRYYSQARAENDFIGRQHPLAEALWATPEIYEMFLRRWTSVHEDLLQPPNTHPLLLKFERRVDELAARIAPDAMLDLAKWGTFAPSQTLPEAVAILKTEYFAQRRGWIFDTLRYANNGPYLGPQPANAMVDFGAIEFNPASGNQAQEYVQLTNANTYAVDLSGWRLTGAIDHTFRGGTVIPSRGSLFVSPDVNAFRARTTGPRGSQGLFLQGNYRGQLSARGEALRLVDQTGRVAGATNYPGNPSLAQRYLRVTEIMYHPAPPLPGVTTPVDEFEYLEVKNTGPATMSLLGVRFMSGIEFAFTGGSVTSLDPGQSALIVRNLTAFTARYGAGFNIAGQYLGALDNRGENLRLEDATGEKILDFDYHAHWYPITDGLGFSLAIVDETAPWDSWGQASNWRPSAMAGGSPGQLNTLPTAFPRIVINEILTHTDPPAVDYVELYNPTAHDVDVSGWFLTDDFNAPKKFRLANGTVIPAGDYLYFKENDFNEPPNAPTSFAFRSSGDEAYLFSGDAGGHLTGYFHGFVFGAAENGVAFGRHLTSEGAEQFVAQADLTPAEANAGPKVGPVVISEIHYRPLDQTAGADNTDDEFVELQNVAGTSVSLFDPLFPANIWRVRGGVDFDLPPGVTLAAGGRLVLVHFNPEDAARLASFRRRFGVSDIVRVLGPLAGKLDNSADQLKLYKPDAPEAGGVPYILVDEVDYSDAFPWPALADGSGASLQRRNTAHYGNEPTNWVAAAPTAGRAFAGGAAPLVTVQPASREAVASLTTLFSVTADGTAPLNYQWRFNGSAIPGATNSLLTLTNVQPDQAGLYRVAIFNGAGATESSNAILAVLLPLVFTQHPQGVVVRAGTNVTLSAVAVSSSPIRYQWRLNNSDLPNATNTTLAIANVQSKNTGVYTLAATDRLGSLSSRPATLALFIEPTITQQPLSQSVVPGATVTLSVSVTNIATLPIGYRWRRNGIPITGATFTLDQHTSFLTITNAMLPFTSYSVVVTNFAKPSGLVSATAVFTFLTDTDGDGLPDSWETEFGFNSADANDAALDGDGDGMTNEQEYIAGTDPTDARSYLRIEALTGNADATLTFGAVSNRTYAVQYTETLGAGFWSKLVDLPARATNRVEVVRDPGSTANRYYRLVTPRQP